MKPNLAPWYDWSDLLDKALYYSNHDGGHIILPEHLASIRGVLTQHGILTSSPEADSSASSTSSTSSGAAAVEMRDLAGALQIEQEKSATRAAKSTDSKS